MKAKKSEYIAIILFCTFLAAVALGYLLLPKADFSPLEKRNLEQFPAVSWRSIRSGDWGEEFETYLADHMPGRNFFVGLNAYFEYFTGRQAAKDIRVVDGRLVEAPVQENEVAVTRCMEPINRFAQTVGQEVDLTIIPSAGWSTGAKGYSDAALIDSIYARAGEQVSAFDLTDVFAGRPELYYRTDHHWNSAGAYEAYAAYMASKGRPCRDRADFRVTAAENFHGSTYSRSGLWLTPGETIELWQGSENLRVTNAEAQEPHDGVFYWERLEGADKYTVFLDGNHSLVRIQNPAGEGRLLVIRDSYSNCLGCFLAESYAEVVLVDLRYYKQPVPQLAAQEPFDDILICYSLGNFMSDTNLVFLR